VTWQKGISITSVKAKRSASVQKKRPGKKAIVAEKGEKRRFSSLRSSLSIREVCPDGSLFLSEKNGKPEEEGKKRKTSICPKTRQVLGKRKGPRGNNSTFNGKRGSEKKEEGSQGDTPRKGGFPSS